MNPDDFQTLFHVLGDPETMWHHPYTFDGQHGRDWIERNMNRISHKAIFLFAGKVMERFSRIQNRALED